MRIIPPLEITTARLTACNVAEPSPDEQVYDADESYALGDVVISTVTHRKYESLIADNEGHPLDDSTKWADVGPTNRYAMFDHFRSTLTQNETDIELTITPGQRVDSIALIGITAVSVEITVTAGDGEHDVYSRQINMVDRDIANWYEYFFKPFELRSDILLTDLPPFIDAQIHVKLIGENVALSTLIVGQSQYVGSIEDNATDDALNFSKTDRDEYGNVTALIQRRSVPTTDMRVVANPADGPRLRELREQLNAKPALWIGVENTENSYFSMLLRLGFYKRFSFDLVAANRLMVDLQIEEM